MLTEFFIEGLFGERDVKIGFDSSLKILVAENGYGKTTILNSFHALISGGFAKLRKIEFSKIGVAFDNGQKFVFDKSEFGVDLDVIKDHPLFEHLASRLGFEFVAEMLEEVREIPEHRYDSNAKFRQAAKSTDMSLMSLRRYIRELRVRSSGRPVNSKTQAKLKALKENFPLKTLYLPTYRRVEEDIKAFGEVTDDEAYRNLSINFGMGDVDKRIQAITSEILSSSVEWFSKINGQMLSQLVNGFQVTEAMRSSISSPRAVEIVLERIGKNISESHKEQMLDLVRSGDILTGHDPLVYFVANLLAVYEQQQENDAAIQSFTSVSNKYLRDKEIVYNESDVTIQVVRKKNGRAVALESLSSGEKQIISLFALLYLEKKQDLAIFFDEPELSLSIEWQRTLLPDIVNSGKCKFLFCTTHSPFVFDNELQGCTVDLSRYIKEL